MLQEEHQFNGARRIELQIEGVQRGACVSKLRLRQQAEAQHPAHADRGREQKATCGRPDGGTDGNAQKGCDHNARATDRFKHLLGLQRDHDQKGDAERWHQPHLRQALANVAASQQDGWDGAGKGHRRRRAEAGSAGHPRAKTIPNRALRGAI
jgi:hypothetical protein